MPQPSLTRPKETRRAQRRSRGQALAELGITLSLLMVVLLGIFQVSYLIYQQYVALNLAREGANLILRPTTQGTSFDDTAAAIRSALADPQFDVNTRLILSVVKLGPPGGPNAAKPIISQRHAWGMPTGASVLGDPPSASYLPGNTDYVAAQPATDTNIQATLPNGFQINPSQPGPVYVAEIYRKRRDIFPLASAQLPDSLYSVTYF